MNAVAVSFPLNPAWDALSKQIESLGIALSPAETEADYAPLVGRLGHPPLVVYNPQGSDQARKVLEWAKRQHIKLPVVVIVEKSDFSHYHECMHYGASAYDEVSSGPDRIARIIRRACGVGSS